MVFIYPLLLGGLVLIGVPILLHLIMKQKPKHLLFPAFRFLLQRHRTNQRKLRLRHLLLLALRLLLIAAICLALARPKIFSERINLGERPVAAVLVFDTSPSMEYLSGGQSSLEAAKRRALELLDELPEGSRVSILDTADPGGQWLPTLSLAREQIAALTIHPANAPVTSRLGEAYRLFADLDQEAEGTDDALPKFLYLLSDRAQNSWDLGRMKDLQALRDRLTHPVNAVYVDVGVDSPVDVALTTMELEHRVGPDYDRLVMKVTVLATGADCDTEIICRLDGAKEAEHRAVKLAAGQSQVITFERDKLTPGFHQAEVTLATEDSLNFNNALFATFEVRGGRRVLLLVDEKAQTDEKSDAFFLKTALELTGFRCEVLTLNEFQKNVFPQQLNQYQAVCLLNVSKPDRDSWEKLAAFVKQGGGLAVAPGGEELDRGAYNEDKAAQRLMPGRLIKVVTAKTAQGVVWKDAGFNHSIMAAIRGWSMNEKVDFQQVARAATRYWEVERHQGSDATTIVAYDDAEGRPALLERSFDRKTGFRGRVLLYTTPLDRRHLLGRQPWNDYLKDWFYLAFAWKTIGYLAGDAEELNFNFLSGQPVTLAPPPTHGSATFTLKGPGLSSTEAVVSRPQGQDDLTLTQAVTPGNFTLLGPDGKKAAEFSVNALPEESQIDRKFSVPADQIESLLGAGSLLPIGHGVNLREALQGHWSQPLEMFPWLMLLVLFILALENLLANKFYRRESMENEEPRSSPTPSEQEPIPEA